jgi:hypothetical protein
MGLTNIPNGFKTFTLPSDHTEITEDYTIMEDDTGKVFTIPVGGVTVTLDSISHGRVYRFLITAETGTASFTIQPATDDGIWYNEGFPTANIPLVIDASNQVKGNYVLINSWDDGTNWRVIDIQGQWEKES